MSGSEGFEALKRAASDVALNESIEGTEALVQAAIQVKDERNIPGAVPSSAHKSMDKSLEMSAGSATIQAALSSSAQLGGQAVTVSLPTETPMKMSPAKSAEKEALRRTAPSNMSTPMTNDRGHDEFNSLHHAAQNIASVERQSALKKDHSSSMSATSPHVTINLSNNTAISPTGTSNPLAIDTPGGDSINSHNAGITPSAMNSLHRKANFSDMTNDLHDTDNMPTLKAADSEGLDNSVKSALKSPKVNRGTRSVHNPPVQAHIRPKSANKTHVNVNEDTDEDLMQSEKEKADLAAKKAAAASKAKYLLNRAYTKGAANKRYDYLSSRPGTGDSDRYSNPSGYSQVSSISVTTSQSELSRRLRQSQERERSSRDDDDDRNSNSVSNYINTLDPRMKALLISQREITIVRSSRSRANSPDSRASRDTLKRPSTADSMRSSRSKMSAGSNKSNKNGKGSKKLNTKELMKISNRLTKPVVSPAERAMERKNNPDMQFLLFDEAKNCSQKPFKAKQWAGSNTTAASDDDNDAKEESKAGGVEKNSFLDRMTAQEYHRREDLEFKQKKLEYDALLTRKQCPNCGKKQSYDEFIKKRNRCQDCSMDYQAKLRWNQVESGFFHRYKTPKVSEFHKTTAELAKEIEESEVPMVTKYNARTGKTITVKVEPKFWNNETKTEFFERMEEKETLAKQRMEKVEDEAFTKVCTFKPALARPKDDEDEEEDEERAAAFMRRLEEEEEERRKKNPERFREKFKPDEKTEGKAAFH